MTDRLSELKEQITAVLPEGVDFDAVVGQYQDAWNKADASQQELMELAWRSRRARADDSPDGYSHFFWCCTRKELPLHALYAYIVPVYFAHGRITRAQLDEYFNRSEAAIYRFIYDEIKDASIPKIGVVIQASRELIKTTAVTIYFTAYRIGQEPHRANLLVQVGDDIAKDNTAAIARIVDEFQGFKATFPHVVADRVKGWGDKGYEVKRIDKTPEEWNQLNATRKDPTLLGVGYSSHSLIGKHPDGVFVVDDVHDEKNTASDKEMDEVLRIVESVMGYAFTSEAWVMYIGTPWREDDTLDYIKKTGEYLFVKIPAYMEIIDGEMRYPEEWKEETEKVFMWEAERGLLWVTRKLNTSRSMSEFYRMIILNLKAAGEKIYKFQPFPHKELKKTEWLMTVGIDPNAVVKGITGKGISHFAMCKLFETPYNTGVIGGGFIKKCDIEEGEKELATWSRNYPNFKASSVERNGQGILFTAMASRNKGLRIIPHLVSELGHGNKETRQFEFLSGMISNATVLVSDEEGNSDDAIFLRIIRNYFHRFPNLAPDAPELDAADALCMALLELPKLWTRIVTNMATGGSIWDMNKKQADPYAMLLEGRR